MHQCFQSVLEPSSLGETFDSSLCALCEIFRRKKISGIRNNSWTFQTCCTLWWPETREGQRGRSVDILWLKFRVRGGRSPNVWECRLMYETYETTGFRDGPVDNAFENSISLGRRMFPSCLQYALVTHYRVSPQIPKSCFQFSLRYDIGWRGNRKEDVLWEIPQPVKCNKHFREISTS